MHLIILLQSFTYFNSKNYNETPTLISDEGWLQVQRFGIVLIINIRHNVTQMIEELIWYINNICCLACNIHEILMNSMPIYFLLSF